MAVKDSVVASMWWRVLGMAVGGKVVGVGVFDGTVGLVVVLGAVGWLLLRGSGITGRTGRGAGT